MPNLSGTEKGFTLIELMIVVVLICMHAFQPAVED